MLRLFITFILISAAVTTTAFAQNNRSAEINNLKASLESTSSTQRVNAARIITRSDFRDDTLYLQISLILKARYRQGSDANHIDEMAWMCKALAASGDPKYKPLLNEISAKTSNPKLQRYARQSAAQIDDYAARREVFGSTEFLDAELKDEENRYINMLRSGNLNLQRDAARKIFNNFDTHPKVYSEVAATINILSKEYHHDILYVDALAWLCKALAGSGDKQYLPVLEQVVALTADHQERFKLKAHAIKARDTLK